MYLGLICFKYDKEMQLEFRVSQSHASLKFILALAFAKLQRSKAPLEKMLEARLHVKMRLAHHLKLSLIVFASSFALIEYGFFSIFFAGRSLKWLICSFYLDTSAALSINSKEPKNQETTKGSSRIPGII